MLTKRLLPLAFAAVVCLAPAVVTAQGATPFLVPGVDPADMKFDVGSWCRYVVVDSGNGFLDSTGVYIAVTGKERVAEGQGYWVEIETRRLGNVAPDEELTRALIDPNIIHVAPGEPLKPYVHAIYIKRGNDPTEAAELDETQLYEPNSAEGAVVTEGVRVGVADRVVTCTRRVKSDESTQTVPMGSTTLEKYRRDDFTVWTSPQVPLFGLAQCDIVRERRTATTPAIPGIPDPPAEVTRTTARLVAFGTGAEPTQADK